MEKSVVGTLIKLSNRSDFKELHKKYYHRKEIKIFREYISDTAYILTSIKYQVRGTEAVGLMSGLMGIAMFLDNVVIKNDETELRRILKVT